MFTQVLCLKFSHLKLSNIILFTELVLIFFKIKMEDLNGGVMGLHRLDRKK